MPKANDKPGIGAYECLACGHGIVIIDENEVLTKCPMCGCTEFKKVE